jgi:hypothetical protein
MIVKNDLLNHWKVKLLCKRIGDGPALRALLSLWAYCEQRRAWEFTLSALELAGMCDYGDSPELLQKTLLELRFIAPGSSVGWWRVNGWEEVNSSLVNRWNAAKARTHIWTPRGKQVPIGVSEEGSIDVSIDRSIAVSIGLDRIGLDRRGEEYPQSPQGGGVRDLALEPDGGTAGAPQETVPPQGSVSTPGLKTKFPRQKEVPPGIQRIYDAFPRKKQPDNAFKAIAKALATGIDPEELLRRTLRFAESVSDTEQQFIPYPASWFNSGDWKTISVHAEGARTALGEVVNTKTAPPPPEGWEMAWKDVYDKPCPTRWEDLQPFEQVAMRRHMAEFGNPPKDQLRNDNEELGY